MTKLESIVHLSDMHLEGNVEKRKGCYNALFYHFVWTTKQRVPLIDDEIETAIKTVFASKARDLSITIVEANAVADHAHVLVRSIPSLAPSDIAKHLKGSSSHFVNHVTLASDHIRSLYWQDGYGVTSVSPTAVRSVSEYIRNQKQHHAQNSLEADLEISGEAIS